MTRSEPPPSTAVPQRPGAGSGWALIMVTLGGAAGTAVRYYLTELIRPWGLWPTATFAINVTGAFVLGMLLEGLARRGPDVGSRRRLRLLGGTGFCGAFTTYSALAVDTDLLVRGQHLGLAVGYGLGTVVVGLAAAALGVRVAGRGVRRGVSST